MFDTQKQQTAQGNSSLATLVSQPSPSREQFFLMHLVKSQRVTVARLKLLQRETLAR